MNDKINFGNYCKTKRAVKLEGDTYGENGLLICGKCGTLKEKYIESKVLDTPVIKPIPCDCKNKQDDKQKEIERLRHIDQLKENSGFTKSMLESTFENDDRANARESDMCKDYVNKFDKYSSNEVSVLLCGDIGTGKSFLAYAIGNSLLEKGYSVICTTVNSVILKLNDNFDKVELMDKLSRCDLLILDDIGTERDTSYGNSIFYEIIEKRLSKSKPFVFTTNLSDQSMKNTQDLDLKRTYDRITVNCGLTLVMTGKSRREAIRQDKRAIAKAIMKNEI